MLEWYTFQTPAPEWPWLLTAHPRRKEANILHKEIQRLWKESAERAAILATMSKSEIKRRRYDK